MSDIFADIFSEQPPDPTEAARRALRPSLRKRFYQDVTVTEAPIGFAIALDGRPVRTPARRVFEMPTRALADAVAEEWALQEEVIDPAKMPLTRLANSIIDGVMPAPAPVRAEIESYVGSDLLLYRADGPQGLVASQSKHWDPVLDWARDTFGARFVLAQGVVHVRQPDLSLAAIERAIPRADGDPRDLWRLGALNAATTLTGSALLALALAAGRLSLDEAWTAAHVDEDWNMAFWGRDTLALERRTLRFAEMQAAATVLVALR